MQKENLGNGSSYQFSSSESQMILMEDLGLAQRIVSVMVSWVFEFGTRVYSSLETFFQTFE